MSESTPIRAFPGRTTTEKRFVVAFTTMVVVFAIASYSALAGLERLHSLTHEAVTLSYRLEETQRLGRGLRDMYAHQAHTIILGNDSHLPRYERANQQLVEQLRRARSQPQLFDSGLVERIGAARELLDRRFRDQILPAVHTHDATVVQAEHKKQLVLLEKAEAELDEHAAAVKRQLEAFDAHGSAVAHAGFRDALLLLVGVTLLTVLVGIALGRSVARPLALLYAGVQRIARGDLSARVEVAGPLEFRELAEQFNRMAVATKENQARLVESERLATVGRIAAGVAHEINNPLGVIRGYTRLLAGRVTDPEARADLQIIEDECLRSHQIVRALLDLARPPTGPQGPTDLRELVDAVVERLAETSPTWNGQVDIEGEVMAQCSASSVRQVVVNLVDNAFAAAGPDGTVWIRLGEDSGAALLEVRDSGGGIAPDALDRVFEPFFTTKDTGVGLGLAVSRSIARAQRGDIAAKNVAGGASFTLTLPLSPEGIPEE